MDSSWIVLDVIEDGIHIMKHPTGFYKAVYFNDQVTYHEETIAVGDCLISVVIRAILWNNLKF